MERAADHGNAAGGADQGRRRADGGIAMIRFASALFAFSCVLGMGSLGGCASSAAADAPRDRLGCLPFPGPMTLYTVADPARLGHHRSGRWPKPFADDEKERGILYTTRAGFLDLAHVRIAIDWTHYSTVAAREAVTAGRADFDVAGPDL